MSTVIKMSPATYSFYMNLLAERYMPALRHGILSGAMRCIPFLQKRTDEAVPASETGSRGAFNYGRYKMGWKYAYIPEGAKVYNQTPYAGVIEYGRRPKYPGKEGVNALHRWVQRKFSLSEYEAKPIARAIAWRLGKRPLRPRLVMTGELQKMVELVTKEVEFELDHELGIRTGVK
jgi:hypothetical protein